MFSDHLVVQRDAPVRVSGHAEPGSHVAVWLVDATADVSTIRVRFAHVGGGLVARDGHLDGFAVAGEDGLFAPAEAAIAGDEVVVRSAAVPRPVQVRYGWAKSPTCGLSSRDGLPAMPFRSDAPAP